MAGESGSGMTMLFILGILALIIFTGLFPVIANVTYSAVMDNNVTGVEGWFFSLGFQIMIIIFIVIAFILIAGVGLR